LEASWHSPGIVPVRRRLSGPVCVLGRRCRAIKVRAKVQLNLCSLELILKLSNDRVRMLELSASICKFAPHGQVVLGERLEVPVELAHVVVNGVHVLGVLVNAPGKVVHAIVEYSNQVFQHILYQTKVLRDAVKASVYRCFELVCQFGNASVHGLDVVSKGVVAHYNIATSELPNDYIEPLGQVVQDAKSATRGNDNVFKSGVCLVVSVVRGVKRLRDKGHGSARSMTGGRARAAQSRCGLDISPGIMAAEDVGGLCFCLGSRRRKERRRSGRRSDR
jgi:hypothetical protein